MNNMTRIVHSLLFTLLFTACGSSHDPAYSIKHVAIYQAPENLQQAWNLPVANTYKKIFEYQVNAAFCGPASIANTYRSFGIPGFTQSNIFDDSDISYWKTRVMGLTLDELAKLATQNSIINGKLIRDMSLSDFRQHLQQSNNKDKRYIINFNREPLFGVKMGHHSPIGGYLAEEDLVFVLDVLKDYKPFLVSSARLYQAMNTIDNVNNKKRGLLLLSLKRSPQPRGSDKVAEAGL